jgi:FtsH-binding integral membrane protein
LFSLYVVYDTNVILQRNYNGGFIMASMDYYLDILNLFSNILGSNHN